MKVKKNPMMMSLAAASASTLIVAAQSDAALLITQYYEGPSTNKWIEIKNVGTTSETLSSYALGHWNNANAEGYKTGVAPTFSMTLPSTSLPAGGVYLIGNSGNTAPTYAVTGTNTTNNTVINFNGNDSIALYSAGTFATANIVDAIGFTNAGNEGVDKSFVRQNTSTGYNTTAGSDVLDFPSVWANVTNADVINATSGTNNYLGSSTVTLATGTSVSLTGSAANTNVATGGQISVTGSANKYTSEIDELTGNVATGSAPVVTIGDEAGTDYVMIWTVGDAALPGGTNLNGGTLVTSGAEYNALLANYPGFDALISYANFAGAKVVNFSLGSVQVDKLAVVPEPASIGLIGLGLGALTLKRRRRNA